MKRLSKFSGIVASLFLILFFVALYASPVMAADKYCSDPKWADHPLCIPDPVDPPPPPDPDPDDPCANFSSPDYVFWRDSTSKRVPAVTVFLADSTTGCEKELLRIDLADSGPINLLHLAYSSVGSGDSFFGRIVYEREKWLDSSQGPSVWKYDFVISDGEVQPAGDPNPGMVLLNTDPESHQFSKGLDLSPDTTSLVWRFAEDFGDSWKISLRTLDIDQDCTEWPCTTFDDEEQIGQVLVEYDYHTAYPERPTGWYVQNPVWAPYGDRIYFVAKEYQIDSDSHYVMAINIANDGSAAGEATEIFGIENQVPGDPSYRYIRSVASGLDPVEYLAVEIGEDNFVYSCADIYTLNLAACEPQCNIIDLKYEIGGSFQSWLRTGSIVLSGLGDACKFNQIGIWNGLDVNIVTKGYEPEAAALWPY